MHKLLLIYILMQNVFISKVFASIEEKPFFYTKPQSINKDINEKINDKDNASERTIANSNETINEEPEAVQNSANQGVAILFDIPITYNDKVKYWIQYFQTNGKRSFTAWLEKSHRYIPKIQIIFKEIGLPQDLAYLAMIESGLSPFAISSAQAVGYWQFMKPTAERYGLKVNWWLDERRDLYKSSTAAGRYLRDMHKMFNNWYLAAAGYNTGESRIKRLMVKHDTKSFWEIAEKGLVQETKDYVPKLIAAILIAKAPSLYGFRNLNYKHALEYEYFWAPSGTKLSDLAMSINFSEKELRYLNPELIKGFIPEAISGHRIRIPKGSLTKVSAYFKAR